MKHLKLNIIRFCCIIVLAIYSNPTMALTQEETLSECLVDSNCIRAEWEFSNLNDCYEKLVENATNLPRTNDIEQSDNYWHGVVRSLIFRFPDDLELLRIPSKGIIQVRSASRIGFSDLGVNKSRLNILYNKLTKT